MTSEADRRRLLQIARDAIVAHVSGASISSSDDADPEGRRAGVFVTLHIAGALRGCIGHMENDEPLPRRVTRCAIAACSADPRFPAVSGAEVPSLAIEISLLGPLQPIAGPDEIEIGRHGLVIEKGWHRGLLLPQVATEWTWDPETFLSQTCRKAGLPKDAWKNGATISRFEAEVFREPSSSSASRP